MKLCFHYILHISESIRNTGPCWATWQFPIERICGMLLPLVRSRLHPYRNLINNIHIWELLNHLQYYHTIYTNIFPPPQLPNQYSHHVFSKQNTDEKFYFPLKKYTLSQTELKKIKDHFSVFYNVTNKTLKVNYLIVNIIIKIINNLIIYYVVFFSIRNKIWTITNKR